MKTDLQPMLDECANALQKSNKIILTTHVNPDGDAIGSVLAMYHFLKALGKDVKITINNHVPHFLQFLAGSDQIKKYDEKSHFKMVQNADTIIILDLNGTKRLASVQDPVLKSNANKIMIDHHLYPEDFCNVYLTDSDASSTGEIVWRLIKHMGGEIAKDIAEALYVSIMTDTGSFRFDKTDAELHRIIADLIDNGAVPDQLYDKVHNQNSFAITKLMGMAMATMKLYYGGKLCLMQVTKDMFRETGTNSDDIEGFVEKTLMIKGVEVGILVSDVMERSEARISFRSKGEYPVRDLAVKFNGGGHKNAAGARILYTDFSQAVEMLVREAGNLF